MQQQRKIQDAEVSDDDNLDYSICAIKNSDINHEVPAVAIALPTLNSEDPIQHHHDLSFENAAQLPVHEASDTATMCNVALVCEYGNNGDVAALASTCPKDIGPKIRSRTYACEAGKTS